MGGIVIDILEKSNFFWSFGSQKGAKNIVFVQGSQPKFVFFGLPICPSRYQDLAILLFMSSFTKILLKHHV